MKKIFYININNLISMISIKRIILIILVFSIINFITNSIYDITSLNDVIKFAFYGVNNISDLPIELFKFILPNMVLVYLVLSFSKDEVRGRSSIFIIRIGNINVWINSLIISILILCIIYYSIGFITLSILNYRYFSSYIDFINLINILFLMVIYGFIVCLISLLISIFINNESTIFTIILLLYYLSISLGGMFNILDKYIIFNQGMLIKHYNSLLSFQWSYFYLIIFSLIIVILIKKISIKMDI